MALPNSPSFQKAVAEAELTRLYSRLNPEAKVNPFALKFQPKSLPSKNKK